MMTKAFALDLAERALWTFVQTFVAVASATSIASGADLKTAVISAASAGGAAVLSLLKGALAGLKTGTASTSGTVAETAVEQAKPAEREHPLDGPQ